MNLNKLTPENNGYISGKQLELEIGRRIRLLEQIIDRVRRQLSNMPQGRISIRKSQGYSRLYYIDNATEPRKHYLQKGNKLIQVLSNKQYLEIVLDHAEAEKQRLEDTIENSRFYFEDAQQEIPELLKEHIVSFVQNDDVFIDNWTKERFDTLQKYQEDKKYETERGDMVRSKSEVIVANLLFRNRIPYKYEKKLVLPHGGTLFPDFTVLDIRARREIYIELFGMMGDGNYCRDALIKINRYAANGIVEGDRLFALFESAEVPLEIRTVKAVIGQFKQCDVA